MQRITLVKKMILVPFLPFLIDLCFPTKLKLLKSELRNFNKKEFGISLKGLKKAKNELLGTQGALCRNPNDRVSVKMKRFIWQN